MNNNVLPHIKIASPCHANWEEMTGDERTRFCASCRKHVYNLSAMTAAQASNLIREKEGKLCVRYFLRSDGTILTQDCPVGLAAARRQLLKVAAAFVSLLALAGFGCKKEEQPPLTGEPTLLGSPAPTQLMGDIAAPPQTNAVREIKGKVATPRAWMGEAVAPAR